MKIVFLLPFDIELVFLLIEGLLETLLVLLHPVFELPVIVLLHLRKGMVLEERLLKLAAQAHALVNVGLDFAFVLSVLTHLNVLLQLFDLAVFELTLDFGFSILALELLHEERLKVVCLLTHGRVYALVQIGLLLLQSACQVLNVLLLLL